MPRKLDLSIPLFSGGITLARIFVSRGVGSELASEVAQQLMTKDALGAHARDELGISEAKSANPIQAAPASALPFSVSAAAALVLATLSPPSVDHASHRRRSHHFLAVLGKAGFKSGWRLS